MEVEGVSEKTTFSTTNSGSEGRFVLEALYLAKLSHHVCLSSPVCVSM